jgi:hypothetical protein
VSFNSRKNQCCTMRSPRFVKSISFEVCSQSEATDDSPTLPAFKVHREEF